jgi:mannose-6-phosphate isomerase
MTSLIASKDSSSDTASKDSEQLLKSIFTSYITCDESFTKQQLQIMITRLQAIDASLLLNRPLTALESLILRLHSQYPSDIGVFSPILMNYIVLEKGQSFFIGANELHAYISGESNLPLSVY